MVNGLPIWEARPRYRHQEAAERIAASIRQTAQDLEIGPPFELSSDVKDVVAFDPPTLLVLQGRRDGAGRDVSWGALRRGGTVTVYDPCGPSKRNRFENECKP